MTALRSISSNCQSQVGSRLTAAAATRRLTCASSSSPTDAIRWLRGILSTGEAPKADWRSRSGWAAGDAATLLCGVFSAERKAPPGVGARAGVPPFCSGVLGGRCLSKNSGESGPPNRTLFFFLGLESATGASVPAGRQNHQV